MSIVLTFIFFIFGIVGGSIFGGFTDTQAKARDVTRKNDINSIYQKLEEHYNEYGEYPTIKEVTLDYDQKLPGLDREALIDPNKVKINDTGSDYSYEPAGCSAIGCKSYILNANLEDGTQYSKTSLN